ncbi:MAG: peptidoglycan-binding domain-containing protein, partial [Haloferula sp.]
MILRLGLWAVISTIPAAFAEAPRALPVDPSEITPESGVQPIDPAPRAAEAKPLPVGEVNLPEPKKNPASDTPEIGDLPTGEDAVRLQIFLDQAHFGPGVIDGMPGRFTVLAVNAWNEVHGH